MRISRDWLVPTNSDEFDYSFSDNLIDSVALLHASFLPQLFDSFAILLL